MSRILPIVLGTVLLVMASLLVVHIAHAEEIEVRVTYYVLRGVMASGVYTHKDAAACSKWMPFGTQLRFPDGYVVTCKDRGLGDRYWPAWIDVWAPTMQWGLLNIERDYGIYSTVSILRWGWGE